MIRPPVPASSSPDGGGVSSAPSALFRPLLRALDLPAADGQLGAVGHDADVVVAALDEADGRLHVARGRVAAVVVPPRRLTRKYLLQCRQVIATVRRDLRLG